MSTSRVTPKRSPVSPGRDSKFTLRRNPNNENDWWVYYDVTGQGRLPADAPHTDLVELVNFLKQSEGAAPGGSFSITEHSQVVARMAPSGGYNGQQAVHVIGITGGTVCTCSDLITFAQGTLDPTLTPVEGDLWTGPLCGTTYKFSAPNAPRPPTHNLDEVRIDINGVMVCLSTQCGVTPYPPPVGPLANFLAALRRQLPGGGRFRVNEHRRAFTSDTNTFIGIVPLQNWFHPISPLD